MTITSLHVTIFFLKLFCYLNSKYQGINFIFRLDAFLILKNHRTGYGIKYDQFKSSNLTWQFSRTKNFVYTEEKYKLSHNRPRSCSFKSALFTFLFDFYPKKMVEVILIIIVQHYRFSRRICKILYFYLKKNEDSLSSCA